MESVLEIDNLCVHGNLLLNQGQYSEALCWYEMALSRGELKGWGYWNAACAAAESGQLSDACRYLDLALAKGAGDRDSLLTSPHLISLHNTAEWVNLTAHRQ